MKKLIYGCAFAATTLFAACGDSTKTTETKTNADSVTAIPAKTDNTSTDNNSGNNTAPAADDSKKTEIVVGKDGAGVKTKTTDVNLSKDGINVGTKDVKVDINTGKK